MYCEDWEYKRSVNYHGNECFVDIISKVCYSHRHEAVTRMVTMYYRGQEGMHIDQVMIAVLTIYCP